MGLRGTGSVLDRSTAERLDEVDRTIARTMYRYGHPLLRYSLGIVSVRFGILEPPGTSPVADLVAATVCALPSDLFVPILGR